MTEARHLQTEPSPVSQLIDGYVRRGEIAGAVGLAISGGRVVFEAAHGVSNLTSGEPMCVDAIFALASQAKPITAVAIMMLIDDGKIGLDQPAGDFFEPLRLPMVIALDAAGEPTGSLEPADRPVTIRQLLVHTSGLGSGPAEALSVKVFSAMAIDDDMAARALEFAAQPLGFQPGSQWQYSGCSGFSLLGRIVEIVSGRRLDLFMRERIFEPLRMPDTGFNIPPAKRSRIATIYRKRDAGLEAHDPFAFLTPDTQLFNGAGNLYSTTGDYGRFASMLLSGGEIDGVRVLSTESAAEMSRLQTDGPNCSTRLLPTGFGFGLGMAILLDPVKAGLAAAKGTYGWGGAPGTLFRVDPANQLVTVFMMQTLESPATSALPVAFHDTIVDGLRR